MITRLRAAGLVWPTVAALVALAVLIALGTWQLSRKVWKEALIRRIDAALAGPPIEAQPAWSRGEYAGIGEIEYTKVALTGRFDHSRERHVFSAGPRGAPGGIGYFVLTPFQPAGKSPTGLVNHSILVNRGFVPDRAKDPDRRPEAQFAASTTIVALVRHPEMRQWFDNVNDAVRNLWYLRNPKELLGFHESSDFHTTFYLDLLSPTPPGGLPLPLAGKPDIPNRHLEYALTWYGLGLTLIGVYFAFARGRLRDFAQQS